MIISLVDLAVFYLALYLLSIGSAHSEEVKPLGILDLIWGTVDIE